MQVHPSSDVALPEEELPQRKQADGGAVAGGDPEEHKAPKGVLRPTPGSRASPGGSRDPSAMLPAPPDTGVRGRTA